MQNQNLTTSNQTTVKRNTAYEDKLERVVDTLSSESAQQNFQTRREHR